jgi:hypothetical protein
MITKNKVTSLQYLNFIVKFVLRIVHIHSKKIISLLLLERKKMKIIGGVYSSRRLLERKTMIAID